MTRSTSSKNHRRLMHEEGLPPWAFWESLRGNVRSRVGGWKIGGGVTIHGRQLFDELMSGEYSGAQVVTLSVTGKIPERRVADFLEIVWMVGAFPDPRIWCNQVAALAGTMRTSPFAASSAGVLTTDSLQYGGLAALYTAQFFEESMS